MNLVSLQFITTNNFEDNLQKLVELIKQTPNNSLILAPELCLSGYSYESMQNAADFTLHAIEILKQLASNKIISLTMTTKIDENYYNTLYIFSKKKIVHTQSKHHLFPLGEEEKYFTSGNAEDIKLIEIDGLKIAALICFELRFTNLWDRVKGADIILVPAMWGKIRKTHYETLTQALSISNQCYVIASDSANKDMAKGSGVIDPFGDCYRDDYAEILAKKYEPSLIKKMRRYINTGIN